MTKTPSPAPLPMPSRREFFIGMTMLIVVGGYALSRGGDRMLVPTMDTSAVTTGVLVSDPSSTTNDRLTMSNEPVRIELLSSTHAIPASNNIGQ